MEHLAHSLVEAAREPRESGMKRSKPDEGDVAARVARRNDPEATRANILEVATREFAENGLDGARVDEIAEKTRTSKRMIYYYFENKDGLYRAVLENVYKQIRTREADLGLDKLPPERALRKLVESTVEYDDSRPHLFRLVAIENINYGRHVAASETIQTSNASATEILQNILKRGIDEGVFRSDVNPTDLHMVISALSLFRVSNRYTFGTIFGVDFSDPAVRRRHRKMIGDLVLRFVKAD
jgi:AcrR family transcriptional regulator